MLAAFWLWQISRSSPPSLVGACFFFFFCAACQHEFALRSPHFTSCSLPLACCLQCKGRANGPAASKSRCVASCELRRPRKMQLRMFLLLVSGVICGGEKGNTLNFVEDPDKAILLLCVKARSTYGYIAISIASMQNCSINTMAVRRVPGRVSQITCFPPHCGPNDQPGGLSEGWNWLTATPISSTLLAHETSQHLFYEVVTFIFWTKTW